MIRNNLCQLPFDREVLPKTKERHVFYNFTKLKSEMSDINTFAISQREINDIFGT